MTRSTTCATCKCPVRAAKKVGLYTAGGVVYTISPVHTDDYYARKTRELVALGVDAVYHQGRQRAVDAGARENPGAGDQGRLRRAAAASAFALPDRAGALHRAAAPSSSASTWCTPRPRTLANGASHPATEWFVAQYPPRRVRRAGSTWRRSRKSPTGCATSPGARASRSAISSNTMRFTTSTRCPAAWFPI